MMNVLLKTAIFMIGILIETLSEARSVSKWTRYSSDQITFFYSSSLFAAPENEAQGKNQKLDGFEEIAMKKNNINAVDSVTVCQGDLKNCASRRDIDKPYWLEENTGRTIIFNPTEKPIFYKNGFGAGYEAFPVCGWVDGRGTSFQYGGQCYVAVVSDGTKTLSFSFLLGPNVGISKLRKAYGSQLKAYRRIVESAR